MRCLLTGWLLFIIAKSTFMIGTGLTHVIHVISYGNLSPSNTSIVVYWDFLFLVILIVFLTLYIAVKKGVSYWINNL